MSGFGSVGRTPVAADLFNSDVLVAENAALTLSGQAATFDVDIAVDKGDLVLSGTAVLDDSLEADTAATLTLNGQASSFSFLYSADAGTLSLSGQVSLVYSFAVSHGTLTLAPSAEETNFALIPPPGGGKRPRKKAKVELRSRTIEIEKDGRKKRVPYIDRFAPPPPPPPLEIIPDWLSVPDMVETQALYPVEFPTLGYGDPLALKAEIDEAEDIRDAMSILDQIVEDPAIAQINAILAQLSH